MHAGCSGVRWPDNIVVKSVQLGGRWQRRGVGLRRYGVKKALVGVPSCSISPDFSKDPTRSKEQTVPDPAYILFPQQGPVTPGKPGPKPERWGSSEEPHGKQVAFPASTRLNFKFCVLEQQDWTKQGNSQTEGVTGYDPEALRAGAKPVPPPEPYFIKNKCSIVRWQDGPDRPLQAPSSAEIAMLQPGKLYRRDPMLSLPPNTYEKPAPLQEVDPSFGPPEYVGMGEGPWEFVFLDEQGMPTVDRRDAWLPYL